MLVFCSFLAVFYFLGDKIAADHFKNEITSLLKANYRLKFAQNVEMNWVRDKGNHNTNYCIKYLRNNMDIVIF